MPGASSQQLLRCNRSNVAFRSPKRRALEENSPDVTELKSRFLSRAIGALRLARSGDLMHLAGLAPLASPAEFSPSRIRDPAAAKRLRHSPLAVNVPWGPHVSSLQSTKPPDKHRIKRETSEEVLMTVNICQLSTLSH